jgi:hypothetical protein
MKGYLFSCDVQKVSRFLKEDTHFHLELGECDREYAREDRRSNMKRKLEGLVVGPWGEGSKDLHILVKTMADSKVAAKARALGRDISDKELGIVVTQIRKYLSTSFVRAQSLCLINRLSFLGEGAQAAAGRRDLANRLEEGRRRDRQAHVLAHVRGLGLQRVGQLFVQ